MENIHGKCDTCDKIAMVIITNTSIKQGCERKTKTGQMIIEKKQRNTHPIQNINYPFLVAYVTRPFCVSKMYRKHKEMYDKRDLN